MSQLQSKAHLTTYVRSWNEKANALIDQRLGQSTGKDIYVTHTDEDDDEKNVSDKMITVTSATLIVHGKKRNVTQMAKDALLNFFNQAAEKDVSGKIKVEIHIEPDED